jgi:protein-disulfide isomerase
MASRAAQKQQARERRLAEEQALAERARRERRLRMLGGVVVLVAAIVAVAIAISSGGSKSPSTKPTSSGARAAVTSVTSLLSGIPESGTTLGSPSAKVTVTEFGDLKCPVCKDFTVGTGGQPSPLDQIISRDVKSGKVKLVYRSLCTATCGGPQPGIFSTQQAAAYAAGLQGKAWYYIELFYHLQGDETTSYVNSSFLDGIARLVPGLNFSTWSLDAGQSSLKAQVSADENYASSKGYNSTPTVVVQGPKGQAQPIVGGGYPYSAYETAIKSVS